VRDGSWERVIVGDGRAHTACALTRETRSGFFCSHPPETRYVSALLCPAKIKTMAPANTGRVRALSLAAAFARRCGRPPREHHLRLNHHCGKLSIGAVYRGLQDDRAPPNMDRYRNAGKPPRHAGAKDTRLRLDRVVRNPAETLSPANAPPRSSANAASAPPCKWPLLLR
jgi:hypothetical protein